jgi:putative copper resistance protein D
VTTLRFSILGIASVGTLVVTGVVNTWVLVGSLPALFGTEYGQLLLVKLALFLLMLSIAAANRLWLTPRLLRKSLSASSSQDALRQLRRNSLIEAGLGTAILFIVGALGTMSPPPQD